MLGDDDSDEDDEGGGEFFLIQEEIGKGGKGRRAPGSRIGRKSRREGTLVLIRKQRQNRRGFLGYLDC